MASMALSFSPTSIPLTPPPHGEITQPTPSSSSFCQSSFVGFGRLKFPQYGRRRESHVVRMAPDEEKLTRRSPLDFPIEWERPKPGRRPDIFPQFSPMKTPIPPPLPYDPPPEEDEEEEEEKKKEDEEEEGEEGEETEKEEEPDIPEMQ